MNYIKKLKRENELLKESIANIRTYLNHDKFMWPNNQVNVNDIYLRLDEYEREISLIEYQ